MDGIAAWSTPALAGLFLLLAAAEGLRPGASHLGEVAGRWGVNLGCWMLGAYAASVLPLGWTSALAVGQPFAWLASVVGLGAWVAGFLLLDLYTYAMHRLFHAPALWPVHAVHHSDVQVDASTALRHHPLEALLGALTGGVVFAMLGLPPLLVAAYATAALAWQLVQHAELPWPPRVERLLRPLFMTAALHRTHHSADARHHGANFGTVLVVWDRLFRTHCPAPDQALDYGIGVPGAERPLAALTLPFWLGRR